MRSVYALLGFVLVLSGCKEVSLKNSTVPEEYRNEAKLFEKRYRGEIFRFTDLGQGRRAADQLQWRELYFLVDENNRLKIYTNFDFAGQGCESKVGDVLTLRIDDKNRIRGIVASLDRGKCIDTVEGQTLAFEVDEDKRYLKVEVIISKAPKQSILGILHN